MKAETAITLVELTARDGAVRGYAQIDAEDEWLAVYTWRLSPQGYAYRSENGQRVFMHRQLLGLCPGDRREGDHIEEEAAAVAREARRRHQPFAVE